MNKFIAVIISMLLLCVGLAGGFLLDKKLFCKTDPNDTFALGWQAARQRIIDTGIVQDVGEDAEIKSISGIVKRVNGNVIVVNAYAIDPLSDPNLDERSIEVTGNTKIVAMVKKSDEQIQNELKDQQANPETEPTPNPNDAGGIKLYYSQNASIEQIDIGSHITIYSNEDITNKKQIIAQEISFVK